MHSVKPTDASQEPAPEREQKMAALSYVSEAWAEARLDGIDDDCMAMSCLFAAFAELVATYGEEAAATPAPRAGANRKPESERSRPQIPHVATSAIRTRE